MLLLLSVFEKYSFMFLISLDNIYSVIFADLSPHALISLYSYLFYSWLFFYGISFFVKLIIHNRYIDCLPAPLSKEVLLFSYLFKLICWSGLCYYEALWVAGEKFPQE